jgi:amino acid transporter
MSEENSALKKTLTLQDLIFFGIASIIGSGGFNLIGEAVMKGGDWWPLSLLIAGAVFMGSSRTYEEAFNAFKMNTAESDFVKKMFGEGASTLTVISVLIWNILSVSTILVLCTHMLFPEGTWIGQIAFALVLLVLMTFVSLKGLDEDKEIINIFSLLLILILGAVTFLGLDGLAVNGLQSVPAIAGKSFAASLLFFYFILAGFDSLIKFSEEAKDPKDIPRSFYYSNLISIALVLGISLAFVSTVDMAGLTSYENGIGDVLQVFLGGNTRNIMKYFSVIYMLVTTFVTFLSTTRYFFGLGEVYKLDYLKRLNSFKAPTNAIMITFLTSALGILVNHTEMLVRASDFGLSSMLLLVAAAATKSVVQDGRIPWVEAPTALAFAGFLGLTFVE